MSCSTPVTFLGHGVSPKLQVSATLHCLPLCASQPCGQDDEGEEEEDKFDGRSCERCDFPGVGEVSILGGVSKSRAFMASLLQRILAGRKYRVRALVCNTCLARAGGM